MKGKNTMTKKLELKVRGTKQDILDWLEHTRIQIDRHDTPNDTGDNCEFWYEDDDGSTAIGT